MKVKTDKTKILTYAVFTALVLSIFNTIMIFSLKGDGGSNVQDVRLVPTTTVGNANQARDVKISQDDDPYKGSNNAKVVIVEFSDFQCPFCARFFEQTLPLLEKDYIQTGKVKLVYRDFPLSFHQYAEKAAEAAQCANEQGKFWEYHDILFSKQSEWASAGEAKFVDYAKKIGLDKDKFESCLNSGKYKSEVSKDLQDGIAYGVQGTPTFFINGIAVVGAQPYEVFKQVIDQELSR